jgi:hypothetical protein
MRALVFTHPQQGEVNAETIDERNGFVAQHLDFSDASSTERKVLVEQVGSLN